MEWGVTLVSSGPYQGLPDFEPSLLGLRPGHRVSLVATIEVRDHKTGGGHLCRGIITGQRFRLKAEVPAGIRKVTILGGSVSHIRGPVVTVDDGARVLHHKEKNLSSMFKLLETCSGLGALGMGAKHAGWVTQVHNDKMQSFAAHVAQHDKVPSVCGDICSLFHGSSTS